MKTFKLFTLITLTLFSSCKKDAPIDVTLSNGVNGCIQKGPFISGSSVIIQTLDDKFSPSGTSYNTTTINDFGTFKLDSPIKSNYIELITQGFYFNEVNGRLSDAPLTLRGISSVNENLKTNINILTTLARNRIIYLVNNEGISFSDAKTKAEIEILKIFNIDTISSLDFNLMDISQTGEQNAILIAVSSILQGNLSVAQLSENLSKIILDIEPDGKLDDVNLQNMLIQNAKILNLLQIRNNITQKFVSQNSTFVVPNFEKYATRLLSFNTNSTTPKNNELNVAFELNQICLTFNKTIDINSVDTLSIILCEKTSKKRVKWISDYTPNSTILNLKLNQELLPETTYSITINNRLKANDGTILTSDYYFEFTTEGINIQKGLTQYYPMNKGDIISNFINVIDNSVRLIPTKDKNGKDSCARVINKLGSIIEFPNAITTSGKFSYSLWFKSEKKIEPLERPTILKVGSDYSTINIEPNGALALQTYQSFTVNFIRVSPVSTIEINKWYHLVFTAERIEGQKYNVKIFLQGVEIYSGNCSMDVSKLAFSGYSNGNLTFTFYGAVDEIKIYDRILNKYEIQKLYIE